MTLVATHFSVAFLVECQRCERVSIVPADYDPVANAFKVDALKIQKASVRHECGAADDEDEEGKMLQ